MLFIHVIAITLIIGHLEGVTVPCVGFIGVVQTSTEREIVLSFLLQETMIA